MKRIVLFVVTNLAVMLVLGIAASLLGVNRFLTANGLNLPMLLGLPHSWALAARSSRC
jgi:heat shock protein HtpX